MNVRNEIKAQIIRAGMTMQEVVDLLSDEYGWSDSVSNLSAKLQRESIRYKAAKTGEVMPRQHPLVVPVPLGTPQCCLWMAVKDTLFAAAVCKEKFTGTASCRRADHGKSCRHFRIGQQRLPQQPHSPSGEPSESPRHFAASMDESVIVGYYTLKKCLSAAPRCLQILRKGQKIYGKK